MNKIAKEIADVLSEEALLEQLTEECGELIQQCSKRLRILRGENYTPVSKDVNFDNLTEEMADVIVSMTVLSAKVELDSDHFLKIKNSKLDRWINRLQLSNRM